MTIYGNMHIKYVFWMFGRALWVSGLVFWDLYFVFCVSGLVFGCLDLYFGCLDLHFGYLDLHLGIWTCIWVSVYLQDVTMAPAHPSPSKAPAEFPLLGTR